MGIRVSCMGKQNNNLSDRGLYTNGKYNEREFDINQ